jgi:hypothetical protein
MVHFATTQPRICQNAEHIDHQSLASKTFLNLTEKIDKLQPTTKDAQWHGQWKKNHGFSPNYKVMVLVIRNSTGSQIK